jgi:hypothetical protein
MEPAERFEIWWYPSPVVANFWTKRVLTSWVCFSQWQLQYSVRRGEDRDLLERIFAEISCFVDSSRKHTHRLMLWFMLWFICACVEYRMLGAGPCRGVQQNSFECGTYKIYYDRMEPEGSDAELYEGPRSSFLKIITCSLFTWFKLLRIRNYK